MQALIWTDYYVSYSDDIIKQQENIRKVAPDNSEIFKLNFEEDSVKEIRTDIIFRDSKTSLTIDRLELRERSRFSKIIVELYLEDKSVQKVSLENIGMLVNIGTKTFNHLTVNVEGVEPIKFQIGLYRSIPVKNSESGCSVS